MENKKCIVVFDKPEEETDFIDDTEEIPMTNQERKEFDNMLKKMRQGVIKRRLAKKNDLVLEDILENHT